MTRKLRRRDVVKGAAGLGAVAGIAGCTQLTGGGDGGDGGDGGGGGGGGGDVDGLLVIGYPQSGIQIFSDFYSEFDTEISIFATDGLKDPEVANQVGAERLTNVIGTAPAASGPGSQGGDFFSQLYQDEYGSEPGVFTTQAYDAGAVLSLANVAAGANDGQSIRDQMQAIANPEGEEFGPSNLPDAIEAAAAGDDINYVGASSSVNFDENGDVTAGTIGVWSYTSDGVEDVRQEDFQADPPTSSASYPGSSSGRTVRYGVLQPLSGDLGSVGQPIAQAAELPATQLNSADTGFTFETQTEDTQTDTQAAISGAERLVNGGYPSIAGAASSSVTIAVANQVLTPNQVVGCAPPSTSPAITGLEDDGYLYRTATSDALQSQVLAQLASDEGASTVSTLYVNNAYGQALSEAFAEAFENGGGSVPNQVSFESGQSSYTSQLTSALGQ
jgi:ABC-type branched-subunit amino acid transport system substrate-binding protein